METYPACDSAGVKRESTVSVLDTEELIALSASTWITRGHLAYIDDVAEASSAPSRVGNGRNSSEPADSGGGAFWAKAGCDGSKSSGKEISLDRDIADASYFEASIKNRGCTQRCNTSIHPRYTGDPVVGTSIIRWWWSGAKVASVGVCFHALYRVFITPSIKDPRYIGCSSRHPSRIPNSL